MTDTEVYKLVGERAAAIAGNEKVKAVALKMYLSGTSMEKIKDMIYSVAIATLYGNGGSNND